MSRSTTLPQLVFSYMWYACKERHALVFLFKYTLNHILAMRLMPITYFHHSVSLMSCHDST